MKIQVIIGSVREGRTAIKVARWVQKGFEQLNSIRSNSNWST